METIRKYLEMSFATLPKTAELFRLKEEMAINMEDKYNALKAQGKSENEAVGIVIAEFGNIEEIAKELGVPMEQHNQQIKEISLPEVTLEDAYQYIETKHRSSVLTGIGVMLCILGAAVLVGTVGFVTYKAAPLIGVVILLMMVAAAVGMFIFADSKMEPWKFIEKDSFLISPAVAIDIRNRQESNRRSLILSTIIAVVMYILGPIVIISSAAMVTMMNVPENTILFAVVILLCMVAVATMILITSSEKNAAFNALLQKKDYSPEGKKSASAIEIIAAFWWPASVAIFLGLGFLTQEGFKTAWVVWPISGVLFGAVAGVVEMISQKHSDK